MSLDKAIDADMHTMTTKRGHEVCFYSDTSAEGRPLVLLHSVNAAPSSMEMRPLFERYRGSRPVYALDLPGFGMSQRTASDRLLPPIQMPMRSVRMHAILPIGNWPLLPKAMVWSG